MLWGNCSTLSEVCHFVFLKFKNLYEVSSPITSFSSRLSVLVLFSFVVYFIIRLGLCLLGKALNQYFLFSHHISSNSTGAKIIGYNPAHVQQFFVPVHLTSVPVKWPDMDIFLLLLHSFFITLYLSNAFSLSYYIQSVLSRYFYNPFETSTRYLP